MRSIWKGSIAFGLVNVPVKVYSATEDHDIRFHQVHAKDGGRIKYNRVCSECGQTVQFADIDKAYDSEEGDRVVLTDGDFEKLPAAEKHEIPVRAAAGMFPTFEGVLTVVGSAQVPAVSVVAIACWSPELST